MSLSRRVVLAWLTVLATAVALVGLGMPAATAAPSPVTSTSPHTPTAPAATTTGGLVPLTPYRVLDTRTGSEPGAKSTTTVTVTGKGGVPTSGVAAVVINLTAVSPAGPGFVTAYPAGSTLPSASNLNYVKGQIVANQAIVKLGTNGRISLYPLAKTNLIVDVTGYYPTGTGYDALVPSRILDTRSGKEPTAGSTTPLVVTGKGGVPTTGVAAVVLNVTAVNPAGPGFLTAWPAGVTRPTASILNYATDSVVADMTIAKVGTGGAINLYTLKAANLVVDVAGWIPAGTNYTPITPTRILDTRNGTGAPKGQVPAKGTISVQATGLAGIPAGATAVEATITAVTPTAPGFVTAWPAGVTRPTASTLNYTADAIVANSATVKLGTTGKLDLYTLAQSDLLIDITGYWTARPAAEWGSPQLVLKAGGGLSDVSCVTSGALCVAVSPDGSAAESRDAGATWSAPAPISSSALVAVSCATTTFCVALDQDGRTATFNGTTWTGPTAINAGITWNAISCAAQNSCMAVGGTVDSNSNPEAPYYDIMTNGSWGATTQFPGTAPEGNTTAVSVSCASTTFCAAGTYYGSAITWSAGAWGAWTALPVCYGFCQATGVSSISCPAVGSCLANAGGVDGGNGGFSETFELDNGSWTANSAATLGSGIAYSISCAAMTSCGMATSGSSTNGGEFTGYSYFDGTTTQSVDVPNYGAVSCMSDQRCIFASDSGIVRIFAKATQEVRAVVDPLVGSRASNWPPSAAVGCNAPDSCVAVDASGAASVQSSSGWTAATTALDGADPQGGDVYASCVLGGTQCTVSASNVNMTATAATYAGSSWSSSQYITSPEGDILPAQSLTCPTTSFCAATVPNLGGVFVFDGKSWNRTDSSPALHWVSCTSGVSCLGVDGSGSAWTWNGSSWTPILAAGSNITPTSLSCAPDTKSCLLTFTTGGTTTSSRWWNGMAWSEQTTVPGGSVGQISCATSEFCMAIETSGQATSWNGSSWSTPVSVDSNGLASVSCPSATYCAAIDKDGAVTTYK